MTEPLLHPYPEKARKLRKLLAEPGACLPVPGAFNAIVAKLVERAGFPALYVSGAGTANGVGGYPDIGMMTLSEMAQQAGYIARATHIPAIADADTGFGEAINVFRTVQEYERAGLSGLHIEDQVFPKRCGHLDGKQVISTGQMAEKIAAAVAARQDKDFLLIARTDAKAIHGFDDAVQRAHAYLKAGADMIFPEALQTEAEFAEFARQVQAPLLANMTEFGKTPMIPLASFQQMGYKMVIYPMTMFRVMMKAMADALAELQATGTQAGFMDRMTSRAELYEILHYSAYTELEKDLGQFAR